MMKAARTRDPNNRGQEGISYHSGTPLFLSTEHKQSRAEAPAAEQSSSIEPGGGCSLWRD